MHTILMYTPTLSLTHIHTPYCSRSLSLTHTHTHTQTHRHTNTHTDTHTTPHTPTHTQPHAHSPTHICVPTPLPTVGLTDSEVITVVTTQEVILLRSAFTSVCVCVCVCVCACVWRCGRVR